MGDEAHKPQQMMMVFPPNAIKLFDRRARDIVCDKSWNDKTNQNEVIGFRFNPRIADWPICREAEADGWARDLRSTMIATLKRMMAYGVEPDPARAIEMIVAAKMSSGRTWLEETRTQARRYALAKEWRTRAVEECGSVERFIAVKRLSGSSVGASRAVRRGGASWSALSDVSLRMTGEHRE